MVSMYDVRDAVLQELGSKFTPYRIQKVGETHIEPFIEITPRCGYPVINLDFGESVEVYRSTDPDDVIKLEIASPKFLDDLCEAMDYFYVPRVKK